MGRTFEDIIVETDHDYEETIRSVAEVMDCGFDEAEVVWGRLNRVFTKVMKNIGYDLEIFSKDELRGLKIEVKAERESKVFWLEIQGERKSKYLMPMNTNCGYRILSHQNDYLN